MTVTPAVQSLQEFNKAFEFPQFMDLPDQWARKKFFEFRLRLIEEEFREVQDELLDAMNGKGDVMKVAKELADLKYVIYGTETLLDLPSDAIFAEVHRSNMSKLGADGNPVRRSDGKVLKGPNYSEADLTVCFGVSD